MNRPLVLVNDCPIIERFVTEIDFFAVINIEILVCAAQKNAQSVDFLKRNIRRANQEELCQNILAKLGLNDAEIHFVFIPQRLKKAAERGDGSVLFNRKRPAVFFNEF